MKSLQTLLCINSRLTNGELKPSAFLILAVCFMTMPMIGPAKAGFWYEDFTDGSTNDAGIAWGFLENHSIVSGGLLLSTDSSDSPTAAYPEWPAVHPGWSIRTQGRLLQDHGFFGASTATTPGQPSPVDTWSLIYPNGDARMGSGATPSPYVETDLRPFEEDVIVQLDTLDGVMRMWAWRAEDPPDQDIAPLIEEDFHVPNAFPAIWARSNDGPSSALFRWMAISTEHMPVNMHVPLSDLSGDFSGDDILDIADIDMLAAQIVAEPSNHLGFDLSGDGTVDNTDLAKWRTDAATHNGFGEPYLVGDSNLDGKVDATDLNNLALNWGADVSHWSGGDFNADGSISALDLNGLAVNWGRTIPVAAAANAPVPEPSTLLLSLVGLTLAWRLPKRNN